MKQIRQTRIASSPKHGSFGAWVLDGQPICLSLEPYKRANAKNVSCIPCGQYLMRKYDSPTRGLVWMVLNVEGRSFIQIHGGNTDEDTLGCIVLGEQFGVINGEWAVLASKKAFDEFMELTKDETEMMLTIVEAF